MVEITILNSVEEFWQSYENHVRRAIKAKHHQHYSAQVNQGYEFVGSLLQEDVERIREELEDQGLEVFVGGITFGANNGEYILTTERKVIFTRERSN